MRNLGYLLTIAFAIMLVSNADADPYMHGITLDVDGEEYYFAGPADGPNGEMDIPGHEWKQTGNRVIGRHYNTGPDGAESWWASEEDDGVLLYRVQGVIDTWSLPKANFYMNRGFIHYHELVNVSTGELHPSKVVWLRHFGAMDFYLDGGPHPELAHWVSPGVDLEFIPNWSTPYENETMGFFVHGLMFDVDGEYYYFAGAPDGPDSATDIPGHYWRTVGNNRFYGLHYNTGPFGAESWWATDESNGILLFRVNGVIDEWTEAKAQMYAQKGFIHYHEMVKVDDGTLHPNKVVWLRHFGVGNFYFDGGPHPELAHWVSPGVDYEFIPNWNVPYTGGGLVKSTDDDLKSALPAKVVIAENYPNPFNAQTTLSFNLNQAAYVEIDIYDITGRKVDRIAEGYYDAGQHNVNWDASEQSSGIYFYKVSAGNQSITRRMTLLK